MATKSEKILKYQLEQAGKTKTKAYESLNDVKSTKGVVSDIDMSEVRPGITKAVKKLRTLPKELKAKIDAPIEKKEKASKKAKPTYLRRGEYAR